MKKSDQRGSEGGEENSPLSFRGQVPPLRVLILEDEPTDFELVVRALCREGFVPAVLRVETESDFRRQLRDFCPDVILADYSLPEYDGLSAMELAHAEFPQVPFLFVSGSLGEGTAIEALKHGAADFVPKQRLDQLGPSVRRALAVAAEQKGRRQAEEALRQSEERLREAVADGQRLSLELQAALAEIESLGGLVPPGPAGQRPPDRQSCYE